ncbi:MAG: glutamate 5-kinase [Cyanobacteria bacterium J06639_1]
MPSTVVIKIGTSSLTNGNSGQLRLSVLGPLVETLSELQRRGDRVILVSSGAVGVGCARLGLSDRPTDIAAKQAVAAVGQGRLMALYDDLFSTLNQPIAQVLLTRADLMHRDRYLNARRTFEQLLDMNVIPVVNENDTVAVDELKFGDNDTLSALVAGLVEADWLILLTDVDRLYSADPRLDPNAKPIVRVSKNQPLTVQASSQGKSGWGTGGMATKLEAAKIATLAGVTMAIANGQRPEQIPDILAGEEIGTRFDPEECPPNARKRWIAFALLPAGILRLDEGAARAVSKQDKSLLPAGIVEVVGNFDAGAAVKLCDPQGREIGRGLTNYSSAELRQIQGNHSNRIADILGRAIADTVVHRDNLIAIDFTQYESLEVRPQEN